MLRAWLVVMRGWISPQLSQHPGILRGEMTPIV